MCAYQKYLCGKLKVKGEREKGTVEISLFVSPVNVLSDRSVVLFLNGEENKR